MSLSLRRGCLCGSKEGGAAPQKRWQDPKAGGVHGEHVDTSHVEGRRYDLYRKSFPFLIVFGQPHSQSAPKHPSYCTACCESYLHFFAWRASPDHSQVQISLNESWKVISRMYFQYLYSNSRRQKTGLISTGLKC